MTTVPRYYAPYTPAEMRSKALKLAATVRRTLGLSQSEALKYGWHIVRMGRPESRIGRGYAGGIGGAGFGR